jgi:hypothetical protein
MVEKEIISVLILATLIGYLFSLAIIAKIRYSSFAKKVREYAPDFQEKIGPLHVGKNGGYDNAGEYIFRTPVYINYKSSDPEITKLIKSHDKIIKLFWISILTLTPVVILILNIINQS